MGIRSANTDECPSITDGYSVGQYR